MTTNRGLRALALLALIGGGASAQEAKDAKTPQATIRATADRNGVIQTWDILGANTAAQDGSFVNWAQPTGWRVWNVGGTTDGVGATLVPADPAVRAQLALPEGAGWSSPRSSPEDRRPGSASRSMTSS